MRKLLLALPAVAVCLGLAGLARSDELVFNGGFETGNFDGWTLNGNNGFTFVDNHPNPPHSGNFAAQLGPTGSLGFLTQNLLTVPGDQYTFSFWLLSEGGTPSEFRASFNGIMVYDDMNSPVHDYELLSFTETATGSSTPIQFAFRNDSGLYGLDDVSVAGAAAVPEPATLILLGVGAVGIAAFASRRGRRLRG